MSTLRARYETSADREREAFIAGTLAYAWQCDATPARRLESWDWEFVCGDRLVALVEIKVRTCPSTRYSTYMIASQKIRSLEAAAERAGCCGVLVVAWTDRIGWIRVDEMAGLTTAKGGRWDRGDPLDVEEVIHVEVSRFRMLRANTNR